MKPRLDAVERPEYIESADGNIARLQYRRGGRRVEEFGRDSPGPPRRSELDVRLLRPANHADKGHRLHRSDNDRSRHPRTRRLASVLHGMSISVFADAD